MVRVNESSSYPSIRARGFNFSSSYREFELSGVRVIGGSSYRDYTVFTNWNRYSGKVDASYVIRRSNTAATIYVGVHTVCLTL